MMLSNKGYLHAVTGLLTLYFNLCRLRVGPQDVPASNFLLSLLIMFYLVVVGIKAMLVIPDINLLTAAAQSGLDVVLLSLFTWTVLATKNLGERFVQTLSALVGAKCLLEIVSIPVVWTIMQGGEGEGSSIAFLLLIIFSIWLLAVLGHIFRHALSVGMATGVFVTIGYLLFSTAVTFKFFPPPAVSG
ncbi:hypothetical protein BOW53_14775 [Solemya pervernicosa gill symbiont]|uniref:Yip1 domain-containing protein n=1 Tax=Solemya pervernicosa gill symbiont TaxID=642797 RepID=A0A1T2L0M7_9GAMM|nr:hypothetical protein [Solemya pervernicosa gill symbiont]OOZ38655.1 hypothetical protein BOW53_14775 [Solemya pervernicosa gill symbiont]